MQKKENAKIKEEIEFYENMIQEKEDEELGNGSEQIDVDKIDTASQAYAGMPQSKFNQGSRFMESRQKSRDRGSTQGGQRSYQPTLVYNAQKKVESEEDKVLRYERVIEKLKKMLDHERKQLRNART